MNTATVVWPLSALPVDRPVDSASSCTVFVARTTLLLTGTSSSTSMVTEPGAGSPSASVAVNFTEKTMLFSVSSPVSPSRVG